MKKIHVARLATVHSCFAPFQFSNGPVEASVKPQDEDGERRIHREELFPQEIHSLTKSNMASFSAVAWFFFQGSLERCFNRAQQSLVMFDDRLELVFRTDSHR